MKGKKILLGVTGGIAAYKTPWIVRLLKQTGAEVICVLTPSSHDFVSEFVLSTLSGETVYTHFRDPKTGKWNNHVDLALWADVLLMTPLTANSLAKMATGQCDNLLMAIYLSMRTQTVVAPAMDLDMYTHPSTLRNLRTIEDDGCLIIPAATGPLASGLSGQGRMEEPDRILAKMERYFQDKNTRTELKGKKVLITAGPTHEPLDPVRFIGNRSSGKMGFALAESCLNLGAEVILISGPTQQQLVHPRLDIVPVDTAEQMFEATKQKWPNADIGIFSAAVADYRPKVNETEKRKKGAEEWQLEMVKNPDILKWAGAVKTSHQRVIGFALESENVRENAAIKMEHKNADMIVMNSIRDFGAGFEVDTNKVALLDKHNNFTTFELKSKAEVADDIVQYLVKHLL